MRFEEIHVNTRDEYRGDQEPLAFVWRERSYGVEAVLDRWYEGSVVARDMPLRYVKVRTVEGETFVLRFHEVFRRWSILVPAGWEEEGGGGS